ncbi:hypothetical protein M0R45_034235 [Rubus argutus]|uniref:Uncharacterized protein n=1 Tax=Rubus argutus TaxID=59490 RepID=A0AAW1VTW5_RUBAR
MKRRYREWHKEARNTISLGKVASMSREERLKTALLACSRIRIMEYESLRQELKKRPLNVEGIRRHVEYRRLANLCQTITESRERELKLYEHNVKLQKWLCYLLDKLGEIIPPEQSLIIIDELLAM